MKSTLVKGSVSYKNNVKNDPKESNEFVSHKDPEIGAFSAFMTYLSYAVLIIFGHIRDFIGSLFGLSRYVSERPKKGYSVLLKSWENFYTRRLYHRIQDCWNRPIQSNPGAYIDIIERSSNDNNKTMYTTNKSRRCLNLGSYNYLGFADDWQNTCANDVLSSLEKWPISTCSTRSDAGNLSIHQELEKTVARFLGKEDAVVYAMGYGTNGAAIPALCSPGTLIISDALNHTSIVNGARSSGAAIRVFKHNNADDLEKILKEAIVNGQPRHHRPWDKIVVMVEGIYSMEGAICNLKPIVGVCKKYKAYIYVDEAHSVGALGATGRGICEYSGIDPNEIDILMGTFTKSFGGMGGYVCASKDVISYLRASSSGVLSHMAMSPTVCQQCLTAFKIIMGEDGTTIGKEKLKALHDNSNFFRDQMKQAGLHVYGDYDSPIIPVMLYFPAKIAAFSRECFERGLAVVVVGFPATSVILSRVRFCISAGHSRDDLSDAVQKINEVAQLLCIKYEKSFIGASFEDAKMQVDDCEVRINISKSTNLTKLTA